jgi:hypothetical protein
MLQIKSPLLLERQEELCQEANKKVKRLALHDKREVTDQLVADAEEAAVQGEHGKL